MGMRKPIAKPRPNETPTRSPVKDPGPVATATLVIVLSWAIRRSSEMSVESRAGMNLSDDPADSAATKAIAAMLDEVSMTKITLHPDPAAIAAKVLDFDES